MKKKDNDNYDPTLRAYFREVNRYKLLTFEDELAYSRRIEQGDQAALNALINANLRFVVKIARKYVKQGMSLQDLIQEGNLGLIKAAKKYNYRKGVRFSTYTFWWIKQSIESALSVIRHSQRHKENSTWKQHFPPISLDTETNQENGTLIDFLADDSYMQPDEELIHRNTLEDTRRFLDILREREKKILMYRFAIGGGKKQTLRTIGDEMGLSPEGVRQIEIRALQKLRCKAQPMRKYFYN